MGRQPLTNTPTPCFMLFCFTPFCPYYFTPLLHLCPIIFVAVSFGWFTAPFCGNITVYLYPLLLGTQLGHKTRPWCIRNGSKQQESTPQSTKTCRTQHAKENWT
jgi:hypothetical protein